MKHVITIGGIRPDWIRLSEVVKKLDQNFIHTMIHTGQHFDPKLSEIFFKDLNIRQPDYNFSIGNKSSDHIEQLAHLALKIKEHETLIKNADIVLFLGDSNSVLAAPIIKKMGVKVGHIEAGMRCGDRKMFEEINRVTCDHVSDMLFCYHMNYINNLVREGIVINNLFNVGNTIVEVVTPHIPNEKKLNSHILLDIHRQENFLNKERLFNIISLANLFAKKYNLPVEMLGFKRTLDKLEEFDIPLGVVTVVDQMGYYAYLQKAYHSKLVISDSGTAQEELAFLKTPVLVPRDFTERQESITHCCSVMVDVSKNNYNIDYLIESLDFLNFDTSWMGNGKTSEKIVQYIHKYD